MPKYRIELSDGRKFEVEADGPPSEQDILSALGSQDSSPAPEPSTADRLLADNPVYPKPARAGLALLRAVKNNPATTGAMVAGAVTAPFTGGLSIPAAAAAVGGASALGAGAGQLASGDAPDIGTMATEGALAATGQGTGRLVMAGAKKAAPKIARGVLRVGRNLQREFGGDELIDTFLKERIPVGRSGEAAARMGASARDADTLIAQATQEGAAPVAPREIIREFRPVMDEVQRRAANASPDAAAQAAEVVERAKALRIKGPTDLVQNQALKRQAQNDAHQAFRAQDKGAQIKDTTAKLDKAVAVGRQKAAEARVPEVRDVNKRTQQLMGLTDALEDAEARNGGIVGLNPVNWLGALAPGAGSRVAFLADTIGRAHPLGGAFRNALLAVLGSALEEEPQGP